MPQAQKPGDNNTEKRTEVEKYIPRLDDWGYPLLDDIVGEPAFKHDLEMIVESISHPGFYAAFGLKPETSFLLYGPPGTGKTHAVKAIRNELTKRGERVLYAPYDIGVYGTAYINQGAVNMQNFFDNARKMVHGHEHYDKAIMFFDECDSLMGKRQVDRNHKEDDKVLETLMKNLQLINSHSDNDTYVFFATNFKQAIDSASIRAGRVDVQIEFPMPSITALKKAYDYEIAQANKNANFEVFGPVDTNKLAEQSQGFNYSDIHTLVQGTIRSYVREIIPTVLDDDIKIMNIKTLGYNNLAARIDEHRRQHYKDNEFFKRKPGFR